MNDYPQFDQPREVVKIMLESDLQDACVRWARARGWWARKLSSPQNRGIMDYMFGKDTWIELVEFKKPGECKKPVRGLSKTQIEEHRAARAGGMLPIVMDDLEEFKRYMDEAVRIAVHEDSYNVGYERKRNAAPYMPDLPAQGAATTPKRSRK